MAHISNSREPDRHTEIPEPELRRRPRKGIYLLPNLFTTAALFAGFYAIIAAIGSRYQAAAIAIFVAAAMDGLDGRVARLTNTQTDFGREYDSLSDMVSFGLAPSLVIYLWSLSSMNQYGWHWKQIGWLVAFMYAAGAALRLARFNTRITIQDPRYFQGLPSPAAAALLGGLVWVGSDLEITGSQLNIVALILTALAGGLMVSNVHFHSFKKLKFNERVPFVYAWIMVAGFVLVAINPALILFLLVLSYTLSGLMLAIYRRGKRLRGRRHRTTST